MVSSRQLEKQLFELKFAAKSLERNSKKSTRLEGEERQKVKKAMEKGNLEGARIHAEAAIRHRNESLHLLQLFNRVDAMASQLSSSMSMKNVKKYLFEYFRSMLPWKRSSKPCARPLRGKGWWR